MDECPILLFISRLANGRRVCAVAFQDAKRVRACVRACVREGWIKRPAFDPAAVNLE
jgi:hypothetical protein